MERIKLTTRNNLEIKGLLVYTGKFLPIGDTSEVIVYAQHRLVKGLRIDEDIVKEISTICDLCVIPEFEEELYETF